MIEPVAYDASDGGEAAGVITALIT